MTTPNPWLPYPASASHGESARVRVLCLPPSGSGASFFASWRLRLRSQNYSVLPVQLPGRESRLGEAAHTSLPALVAAAADGLAEELSTGRDIIFGHSMGGAVAFELAVELRRRGRPEPAAVVISACSPPHLGMSHELPMADASDLDLITMLTRLGGTPQLLLQNEDFMQMMLPALRADLQACETYRPVGDEVVTTPIVAIGGADDPAVPAAHLHEWAAYTTGPFRALTVDGGHHYLQDGRRGLDSVSACLAVARQLTGESAARQP
jgi:medium-chain acyl-[acyl-carrier-protein] hydrolase